MGLQKYHAKRDFSRTAEPRGVERDAPATGRLSFVIQKHAARRLHYDFRLELDGVLLSWAVPKGPSLDPAVKRLAMQTEDHPLDYASFEGTIPKGQYGGGAVLIWDKGSWEPEGDPHAAYRKGHLKFRLHGSKLSGGWHLVRSGKKDGDKQGWLLFKSHDEAARTGEPDVVDEQPLSAESGRSLEQIAATPDRVWQSNRAEQAPPAPVELDPAALPGVKRAKKTDTPEPQLATLVSAAPEGDAWLHELKFDGYRLLLVADGQNVRAFTRNGNDWTARVPSLVRAVAALDLDAVVLDGELVVLNSDGISDFQALQNALGDGSETETIYYSFDLLRYGRHDLAGVALEQRKALLAGLLQARHANQGGRLRYSDHVIGSGAEFLQRACELGLEGIVSKRRDRPHVPGRSRDWLKTKCHCRQEFVIGGYSEPGGSRSHLGALLVGVQDDGALRYAGKVGTGFTARSLEQLEHALAPLRQKAPPFVNPPTGAEARGVRWVRPELVAEVEFTGFTKDRRLRHPSFQGLRSDKPAADVELDREERPPSAPKVPSRFVLTNAERVLYPETRITKRELLEYYVSVSEWLLPHVSGRVLTLLRCPEGHTKHCFFQKHPKLGMPEAIHKIPIEEAGGPEDYLYIDDLEGLLGVVQLGTLEIHTWGAHVDDPEKPDQLVIDLDPDEALPWDHVSRAAIAVRSRLSDLGLSSFVKTTGGKGLHVVLPIQRRSSWDEAKEFCRLLAVDMVARDPRKYVANMSKRERAGKIFVDYLRNGRGATAVAAYSTRARAGAPVSVPLSWEELAEKGPLPRFTIRSLPDRLRRIGRDPWAGYGDLKQSLTKKMWAALAR